MCVSLVAVCGSNALSIQELIKKKRGGASLSRVEIEAAKSAGACQGTYVSMPFRSLTPDPHEKIIYPSPHLINKNTMGGITMKVKVKFRIKIKWGWGVLSLFW